MEGGGAVADLADLHVLVPVVGELTPEADETVRVRVGNVTQATLARPEALLTIHNDDATNHAPSAPFDRTPGNGANATPLPAVLSWSTTDEDAGDVVEVPLVDRDA